MGLWHLFLSALFPARCLFCGSVGAPPLCLRCQKQLAQRGTTGLPPLLGVVSVFVYGGSVRQRLIELKNPRYKTHADVFAPLMAQAVLDAFPAVTFSGVAFVPNTRQGRPKRYNQARVLARRVAAALSLPLLENALVQTREKAKQHSIQRAAQRLENVRDCWQAPQSLSGSILLVDDILTTGATLSSAANALLLGGAQSVYAVTVAAQALEAKREK